MRQELVQYIRDQSTKGVSADSIRFSLTQAGWGAADVNEAFGGTEQSSPKRKSLVSKILFIIIGLLAVLYLVAKVLDLFLGPVMDAYGACYKQASSTSEERRDRLSEISDIPERTTVFCEEDASEIQTLSQCVNTPASRYPLASTIVDRLYHNQERIRAIRNQHNETCPDYPL